MAEPLQCFIIGLLPAPATYSMAQMCIYVEGAHRQEKEWWTPTHGVQWRTCLDTRAVLLSYCSASIACFLSRRPLDSISSRFHLRALLSLHGSAPSFAERAHREQGTILIPRREGATSYFVLYYTFQRKVQPLLPRRRRLRGDFTSKPVEAAFFRLAPRGLRGILEFRGMYLN